MLRALTISHDNCQDADEDDENSFVVAVHGVGL